MKYNDITSPDCTQMYTKFRRLVLNVIQPLDFTCSQKWRADPAYYTLVKNSRHHINEVSYSHDIMVPLLYPTSSLPTCVVQGSQDPELVHGIEHVVFRWWIHEMEEEQILNAQGLQEQYHIGQVGSLNFWYGGGKHLILICTLSVEPEWRRRAKTQTWTQWVWKLSNHEYSYLNRISVKMFYI